MDLQVLKGVTLFFKDEITLNHIDCMFFQ